MPVHREQDAFGAVRWFSWPAGAFGAGRQAFEDFVISEQTVVMNDFMTMYQDSLNSIDMIKEMFVSMCMSLIFIVAFAIIMPIITGVDSILYLVAPYPYL